MSSTMREVSFESGGVRCAADLYWPDNAVPPVPCVVLGHGGSGTKRLGLPKYAAKFTAAGMAALAFDYRGWGASEGSARQVLDIEAQRDDFRAAVRFVRDQPDIDPRRVALWGTSLSGGHVLAVAADDPAIAAVVSQVPLIDGLHRGRNLAQRLDWDIAVRTVQFSVAAIRDGLQALLGQPPYLVPVVAEPGQLAVFTEPEAAVAFKEMGGEDVGWRNEVAPRVVFALPRYRSGAAERLTMPVLVCLADRDLQASSSYAASVVARAPRVDIRHYPIGHFDAYLGDNFETMSAEQVAFLRAALHVGVATGDGSPVPDRSVNRADARS